MVMTSDVTGLTARRLGVCVFCAATLVAIAKTRTKRATERCGLVMSSSAGFDEPGDSLTSGHRATPQGLATPHARDFFGGRRPAEEIPLARIAIMFAQKLHLFRMLHAFGDHFEPEGMAHRDDSGDDRCVTALRNAHQKCPI